MASIIKVRSSLPSRRILNLYLPCILEASLINYGVKIKNSSKYWSSLDIPLRFESYLIRSGVNVELERAHGCHIRSALAVQLDLGLILFHPRDV